MELTGNRFKASVSQSRKFVDINDRKQEGVLVLLTQNDLRTLRNKVESYILAREGKWVPLTLAYPEKGKRIRITDIGLEDAKELLELTDKLLEIVVPA